MERHKLVNFLSIFLQARKNCELSAACRGEHQHWQDWHAKHTARLETLASDFLPSGAGIDSGTKINLDKSTPKKIVLETSFHHMDRNGFYCGWTTHTVTVTPSFDPCGFDLAIGGPNKNDIKDYLHDTFQMSLTQTLVETENGFSWPQPVERAVS